MLEKRNIKVGEKVKQGQLLLAIKNTDLQARQAQVNAWTTEATVVFNNAEKDYKHFKNLFENRSDNSYNGHKMRCGKTR